MGRADSARHDPLLPQAILELPDVLLRSGDHAAAWVVDRGDVETCREVLGDRLGAERAPPPSRPAADPCIRRARIDTTLIAVGRSNTPAMVAATYSPMLCPAYTAGSTP